ncbi:MAG: biotin/lipoyl-binding protein [Spirochaetaceae bacterium]|nr:MAG: biotin/lipoyl-binding protein [Spirochaetaceae bacterium]
MVEPTDPRSSTPPKTGTPIVELKPVRRAGSKRQTRTAIVTLVVFSIAGLGAYLALAQRDETYTVSEFSSTRVARGRLENVVQMTGSIAIPDQTIVSTPERGFIESLLVAEGNDVVEGQVIAVIDSRDLREDLADLESTILRLERNLERQTLEFEFTEARRDREYERLVRALDDARTELETTEGLYRVGAASDRALLDARDRVGSAEDAITIHRLERREAHLLNELSRRNTLDDIEQARTRADRLEQRIAATVIRAPRSGRVLSVETVATRPGTLVNQYAALVTIGNIDQPVVEFGVPERHASAVSVDGPIRITVGTGTFPARISWVGASLAQSDAGLPVLPITAVFENVPTGIVTGGSAAGEITVGVVDDALYVPRGAFLTTGGNRFVYRIVNDVAYKTEVTFGMVLPDKVQIIAGVTEGDELITSGYQSFISFDEIAVARGR